MILGDLVQHFIVVESYYVSVDITIKCWFWDFHTAQKMKFSIKDLRIWSHLLKKSLLENFIFCAVPLVII